MAQISQNTISSTIALPPREEGTGHHCKRWARFDVGRQLAELLLGFCARRRPWANVRCSLARTWQVAFLGEIEPRDARPGIAAPASETSRPSHSPGCQIAPVASAESRRGILEHFRPNEIASLRPAGDYSSPGYTGRGRPRSEVVPGPFHERVIAGLRAAPPDFAFQVRCARSRYTA